jgi:hypothetical protein
MNARLLMARLKHELYLMRKYRIIPRRHLSGVNPPELVTPEHDAGRSRTIPGVAVRDDKKFKHRWKKTK